MRNPLIVSSTRAGAGRGDYTAMHINCLRDTPKNKSTAGTWFAMEPQAAQCGNYMRGDENHGTISNRAGGLLRKM
jgi:hypothetical protein